MYTRDYRDIIGGGLLTGLGLFVALYAGEHYSMGSLNRMGPGMFPVVLGYLLAGLGALIALPGFFRAGERIEVSWRPLIVCLLAVCLFAIFIDRIGMVPTIAMLVIVSAFADTKLKLAGAVLLASVLVVFGAAVFKFGLGISVPLFAWGW